MKRLVGEHFKLDGRPKRSFPTREAAQRHALKYHHGHLDIYQCSFCQAWHFATRQTGRRRTRG
jgi:hypothetical protein